MMMNPFSILNLPESFDINLVQLEAHYLSAQQKFHPDRLVNVSTLEKRAAIDMTARINQAYRMLKDPVARARYFLEEKGMLKPGEETISDPDLLAEIFDLQEQLAEGKSAETLIPLRDEVVNNLSFAFKQGDWVEARRLTLKLGYLMKMVGTAT